MTNKLLCQPPTDLMRARLKMLLEQVNTLYKSGQLPLETDIQSAYSNAIHTFFESLDGSIVGTTRKILTGTPANPAGYNIFTNAIMRDLEVLFAEISALDAMITSSFNTIMAEREQALQTSRRISTKLADYLLYADPELGAGFFFGDSFTSGNRLDIGSSLVEDDECFLDQDTGVILLPLDGEPERPRIRSIIINDISNGTAGSNAQLDIRGHDDISAVGDYQPDTWFEFEKVVSLESTIPLVLDLTIVLESPSIINYLHINPMNFGTPTPVHIIDIDTSIDGHEYISIKDDIPLGDFLSEDEDNVFTLSSATSKYAGQGFYAFIPRRTKYIHLRFEQHTPYTIATINGNRLRYAIGLRDINIFGRKHKAKGSIISSSFSITDDVRKISLWSSENPIYASVLADIRHFISHNDGAVWLPIQPQHRAGFLIPEVVNFNNSSPNAIITDEVVDTFRHKITIERFSDKFDGNITIDEEKLTQTDIVSAPAGGPFILNTTEEPIEETIRVIMPFWGSFGCPRDRYGSGIAGKSTPTNFDMVEFTVDAPADTGTLRYTLPYDNYINLAEKARVFVNGEQWEYIGKDSTILDNPSYTSYTSAIDSDSKVYFLNKGGLELQFGHTDSSGQRGMIPAAGSKIQVCLDGDNPTLELTDVGYVLNLTGPSDGFEENLLIYNMQDIATADAKSYQFTVPTGARRAATGNYRKGSFHKLHKLPPMSVAQPYQSGSWPESTTSELPPIFTGDYEIAEYDISTNELITGASRQFTTKCTFIDGDTELRDTSDPTQYDTETYSFNSKSGTIYFGSAPASDRKVVVTANIAELASVNIDKWNYYRNPITYQIDTSKIILDPTVVDTVEQSTTITSASGVRSVVLTSDNILAHDWYNKKVVKGTVRFSNDLFGSGILPIEVPFIDGISELSSVVDVYDESFTATGTDPIYSFTLGEVDSSHVLIGAPAFSPVRTGVAAPSNQFLVQKASTFDLTGGIDGDWKVVVSGGVATVYVRYTGGIDAHTVSYRYELQDPGIQTNGLYSVDYNNGVVYFATAPTNDGTIYYEVSGYTAFYNIAQLIATGDIEEINTARKQITLKAAFGMKFLKQATAARQRPQFLKIAYEYYKKSTESLRDLEPYFSPICKDIAFRAVTANLIGEL